KHGGLRLLDGDVDAADPGVVHAQEGLEIRARIDHGDAHRRLDRARLVARGGDGFLRVLERHMHGKHLLVVGGPSLVTPVTWPVSPVSGATEANRDPLVKAGSRSAPPPHQGREICGSRTWKALPASARRGDTKC